MPHFASGIGFSLPVPVSTFWECVAVITFLQGFFLVSPVYSCYLSRFAPPPPSSRLRCYIEFFGFYLKSLPGPLSPPYFPFGAFVVSTCLPFLPVQCNLFSRANSMFSFFRNHLPLPPCFHGRASPISWKPDFLLSFLLLRTDKLFSVRTFPHGPVSNVPY